MNPHQVTADFEQALADYTGSKYAVAATSCTMAIFLALQWHKYRYGPCREIECPRYTYVGVAQHIRHVGSEIAWTDEDWQPRGWYVLNPTTVIDSARLFTTGMYRPGSLMCVSFHWTKTLSVGQGGAILTDDLSAVQWLRRARFDGRSPGVAPVDDTFQIGWHAYMSPRDAADGLSRLAALPKHNDPLPEPGYTDLSRQAVFAPHTDRT